jgi:hypothetical protein
MFGQLLPNKNKSAQCFHHRIGELNQALEVVACCDLRLRETAKGKEKNREW